MVMRIMSPRESLSSSGWASDYFAAHTSTAGIPGEGKAPERKVSSLPAAARPTDTRRGHFSTVWRIAAPCARNRKRFRIADRLHAIEVLHSRPQTRWPPAQRLLQLSASQSSQIGSSASSRTRTPLVTAARMTSRSGFQSLSIPAPPLSPGSCPPPPTPRRARAADRTSSGSPTDPE
jgi:hypothetical protein